MDCGEGIQLLDQCEGIQGEGGEGCFSNEIQPVTGKWEVPGMETCLQ